MQYIIHRANKLEKLKKIPKDYGLEVDIRSQSGRLILHHDPFCEGMDFEEWLRHYDHKFLILNIKEEGLERSIKTLIDRRGITDYFYVDLSFPFLVRLANTGEKNIAVRFSEYESLDTCMSLAGKVDWVWVDCFTKFPLDNESYQKISKHFKICLVSPELVGRKEDIEKIKKQIRSMNIDAVCTKNPQSWTIDK